LATVVCWLGFILSFIVGIRIIANADEETSVIVIGVLAIAFGCLFSWIDSFFAYRFGELIEKTTEIAENTAFMATIACEDHEDAGSNIQTEFCSQCGSKLYPNSRCPNCDK